MSKVMLVEDDKSLREIYSIRLVAEGYDIVSASDGEEGLALAVKEKPDLIIADVMMPKISGFDMLDILRSTPETANVKVIMMTALSSDDQRQRGEALGANRYLVKSQVGIEDVVNTVHELLEDSPNANAGANLDTVAAIPTRPATADQPAVPGYEANQAMQNINNTQLTTDAAQDPAAQSAAQAQAAAFAAAQAQAQAQIQAQTQAMEAPQMPAMPEAAPVPAQPAPVVPEVAQAPVAPAPAPAPVPAPTPVATAPVVTETPVAAAPVVTEAPVAPAMPEAPVAPAPAPVAPVAPAPTPAPAPAPGMPSMPEVPVMPETPAAPAPAPAPAITGATSSALPEGSSLEAPATPAVNSLAGAKTEGGERVIQPINDSTLKQNQEALTAEMDALLNGADGPKADNPFNAPTPPPLNVPDAPEIPVATDTSMEGTQDFLAQANDDFSAAVSEAPVAFSTPEEKEDKAVDNSAVQSFEQNEVANAEAQMGLNNELIDEPSTEDVSNITPIQPGYINDLTDQLSEEGGNTQSEIENPLAAAMARELADDPITQQAMERREQAEGEANESSETILDSSDSELPAFLRGGEDTPNLGPNIQSSDLPQGEEAAETVE